VKGCGCESARKGAVTVGIVSNILGDLNENDTKWLCNAHYQRLYKCLNSREPCASCGEKPKFNNKQYYRHCPDPTLITKYLKEVEGLEVDITPDSVVCDQCYKKHNRILTRKVDQSDHEPDLTSIRSTLEIHASIFKQADKSSEENYIQGIASLTSLELCHTLLSDEAVLLLDIYNRFQQLAVKYAEKTDTYSLPSSRWLLVFLSNTFKSTLGIVVKHKCYGTLLYNKNGDILKALSKALGELKVAKKSESNLRQEHNENLAQTSPSAQEMEVSKEMIISVSKHLNKVIISNCKKIAEMYSNNANLSSPSMTWLSPLMMFWLLLFKSLLRPLEGNEKF
jgi:hypothetical protein